MQIINFDDIYMRGGSSSSLPPHIEILLEATVSQLNWVKDPECVYNRIALEFRPPMVMESKFSQSAEHVEEAKYFNNLILNELSEEIRFAISHILLSDCFSQIRATHNFRVKVADIWDGSEGCDWHNDSIEGGDFVALVYLSDHDVWDNDLGGCFQYGKVPYRDGDGYFIDYSGRANEIEINGTVYPSSGSIVVINNHNHFMTHRCFKLKSPKEKRVTLTIGFDIEVKKDFNSDSVVFWPNDICVS